RHRRDCERDESEGRRVRAGSAESRLGHRRDLQGLRRQRVRPVDAVRQRWPGSAALVLHAIRLMRTCTAGLTVALVITAPIAASAQARLAIPSTRLEPAPRSAPIVSVAPVT